MRAVEPPPSRFRFPDPARGRGREGVVCVGGDFAPGTLLAAYRRGIFPWPTSRRLVPWCSPDPRAHFPLDAPEPWSRSLRRALRLRPFRVTVDAAFAEVVDACADREEGTWITSELTDGYRALHAAGWAHSVEVWSAEDGALVGGIYGVTIGAAFAGESMFHRATDASKIAFVHLTRRLREAGYRLFDVQIMSPHLESLGCVELPRAEFLRRVATCIGEPLPLAP